MNTPNDIRWLLFATVPVHGYINVATPISRAIIWLCRRAAGLVHHCAIRAGRWLTNPGWREVRDATFTRQSQRRPR